MHETSIFFCPGTRLLELATEGGLTACCDRPELHIPVANGPAIPEAVQVLDAAWRADRKAAERIAKLDAEGERYARALDEAMASWSREAAPLHDKLGRITFAAWDPHVDGNVFRELVRAIVGHPLMSRKDATAAAASIRAECRRVGIPVADTAEEQLARVRGWAEQTEHGAAAAEVLAIIDAKETAT